MRIKKLSSFVASQIAAGEVIERPASVLKELLENSIDAGSDSIDIELEQGGIKLLRVKDNGCGICKDDLELALMQHATSKISTIEDLEEINSLGFRGEALASIAAVSQLELISKPKRQEMGWEFKLDGNLVQPAPHHDGTTISARNLFYNIPARRKFLRSERTEFNYLEELFKRIALSQFDIAFTLMHDKKKIKQLPKCANELARAKRLAALCGNRMLEQSIYIDVEQNGLHLCGWLGMPAGARSNSENQFFYINNRMIKDRLINHALKQAYQPYCDSGRYPTYCLYFSLDAKVIDVNVHPTKHEVRFRDARVIHAFLTKAIQDALSQQESQQVLPSVSSYIVPQTFTSMSLKMASVVLQAGNQNHLKILCIIGGNRLVLAENAEQILLVDVKASKDKLLINELEQLFLQKQCLPAKPLLMPQPIDFNQDVAGIMQYSSWFEQLGFKIDQIGATELLIRTVPLPLGSLEIDYKLVLENMKAVMPASAVMPVPLVIPAPAGIQLTAIDFAKCIGLLVSCLHYPEYLSDKDALQLVADIVALSSGTNRGEKLTFKQYGVNELQDFIYRG